MQETKQLLKTVSMLTVQIYYEQGQLSQRIYDQYSKLWDWSLPRFGGCIGIIHDAWYHRNPTGYYYRINRVRKAVGLPALPVDCE